MLNFVVDIRRKWSRNYKLLFAGASDRRHSKTLGNGKSLR
jgi:hypothetical protein